MKPESNEEKQYYVSRIIARSTHRTNEETHYLVRWWSYGPAEDTWEPGSSLRDTAPEFVDQFNQQGK